MWDIVWVSPQGHRSVFVSRHFLLQAPQCPCSVHKWFSRDHCCRGRSLTLDYWQPQTTDNDFQRAAAFLSVSVMDYDCRRFSADTLWICVIFGHRKSEVYCQRKTMLTKTSRRPARAKPSRTLDDGFANDRWRFFWYSLLALRAVTPLPKDPNILDPAPVTPPTAYAT